MAHDKLESKGNVTREMVICEFFQSATTGFPSNVVHGKTFTFNRVASHSQCILFLEPNRFTQEVEECIFYLMTSEKYLIDICKREDDIHYLRNTFVNRFLVNISENLSEFILNKNSTCMVQIIHDEKNYADEQMHRGIRFHNYTRAISRISDLFMNQHIMLDFEGGSDCDDNAGLQLEKKPSFMDVIKKPLDYFCQIFRNDDMILTLGFAMLENILFVRKMYS